jgi:hypothetical protein
MLKKAILVTAVLLSLGLCGTAHATYWDLLGTSVAITPNTLNVTRGSTVHVSVDVALPADTTMSAISTRIFYDASVFSYDDAWVVTKGSLLTHDWSLFGGTPAAGELRVGGIQWHEPWAEALASGTGRLFSFDLKVRDDAALGSSALAWGPEWDGADNALAGFDYGDANYEDCVLRNENMHGAAINVASDVPEPGTTVLLLSVGMIGLGIRRLRRKK